MPLRNLSANSNSKPNARLAVALFVSCFCMLIVNFTSPHRLLATNLKGPSDLGLQTGVANGQYTSELDEDETAWRVVESNCQIDPRLNVHRVDLDVYRSSPSSEMIHCLVKNGNRRLVGYDIKPAYVIPELAPSVWVRGNRTGMQMYVRVVLPHTENPDPDKSGPITMLLKGQTYRNRNRWTKLSFANEEKNIAEQLEHEIPFLRTQYDCPITIRDAYVDQVVIDIVSGPGEVQLWIDDVEIDGRVTVHDKLIRNTARPTIRDTGVRTVGYESSVTEKVQKTPNIRIDGSVIEIEGRPFAARVIQHNGEPFEFLQQLGFNVIHLNSAPTAQQNFSARRLGLWLIGPPPNQVGLTALQYDYDRVLAWHLGDELSDEDLERTKMLVREIRSSDYWKERPLIASVKSNRAEYSRLCTIMVNGFEPIGSSFQLCEYSDWLRQRADFAGRTMPTWAVMQTELPEEVTEQVSTITGQVPPMPIEPGQFRFLAYESVVGGARGHWFTSRSRLDGSDPQSRLRANSLRWVIGQLLQMEPWIAGGAVLRSLDSDQDGVEITTLKTSRSRLLLIQRPTHLEQWVSETPVPKKITIRNPSASSADQAFLITEQSLQPLDRGRLLNSAQISIPDCPSCAAVIMTGEPLIIRSINERMNQLGSETMVRLHLDLTRSWLALSQIIIEQMQRSGQNVANASGPTNEATNYLQQVNGLVSTGSTSSAIQYLHMADYKLALSRQTIMMQARQTSSNGSASPLFSHVSLLPLHWDLVSRIGSANVKPNGLIGGEFEDLKQLTNNGWQNEQSYETGIETTVEISPFAAFRGRNGILIKATGNKTPVESPPLWIKSARVPVKAGQMVRIHGFVNIPQAISGSLDGFMIIDSVGGRNLAERIVKTRGWQEFTLYRGVKEDTDLRIVFSLTGFGQVLLDEVTVEAVERSAAANSDENETSSGTTREARQPPTQDDNRQDK